MIAVLKKRLAIVRFTVGADCCSTLGLEGYREAIELDILGLYTTVQIHGLDL